MFNFGATMKKILTLTIAALFCLSLAFPAWAIELEKKGSQPKEEQKPSATQTEKKPGTPVEIAPPKEEKPESVREPQQKPEEKREEKPVTTEREKIKLPPLERKLIDQIDRFVDMNGNGIDDRREGKERQTERIKPPEKKKKKRE